MVCSCSAYGCTERWVKGRKLGFFKFPTNEIKRDLWIKAVNRSNFMPSKHSVLCGKHFQTGRPSNDENHPDYVPNVFSFKKSKVSVESYERRTSCVEKYSSSNFSGVNSNEQDAALSLAELTEINTPVSSCNSCLCKEAEIEHLKQEIAILKKEVKMLQDDNQALRGELFEAQEKIEKSDVMKSILSHGDKFSFYTGLPQKKAFDWLLSVCENLESPVKTVPLDKQLMITLIKLRQNLKAKDLAYRFDTSRTTVSRIFDAVLPYMGSMLRSLITWPEQDALLRNLPAAFHVSVYKDTVCIIDCTEIPIERPGNQKARAKTWSNYKHQHTIKFLIGITPTGNISFLSKCWGGRASDKVITLESGFLNLIKPGDVVLADRGFILEEQFKVLGANLIVPSFVKNKKQLSILDVIRSKMISNVRIHVERVIGRIKKFEILKGRIPIKFLKYINDVVTVCAAVHNISTPLLK